MNLRRALPIVALLFALPVTAKAQSYPDHAVKIVVPVGPAGSYDLLGRLVADQLTKRMGQSFVVENRPGAGSVTGTKSVVTAPPDGYTLIVGGLSNIVFNIGLYKNLPFNPQTDLVPVALIMNISYTLVGNKDLPYSTPKAAHRGSEESARLDQGRQRRRRHRPACGRCGVPGDHRHENAGGAVPRLVAGVSRSARRARRSVLRFDAGGDALRQIGTGQGHRHPDREAAAGHAERADHDRVRRARSRDQFLDRNFRAGQDAGGRDCAAAEGDRGSRRTK